MVHKQNMHPTCFGYFIKQYPGQPIISAHIPKCAGSSLKYQFFEVFGPKHVLLIYPHGGGTYLGSDEYQLKLPVNIKARLRGAMVGTPGLREVYRAWDRMRPEPQSCQGFPPDIKIIHGHKPMDELVNQFPDSPKITVLRNPYERAWSHFLYWREMRWQKGPKAVAPWFDENTPFNTFAFHPDFQNYQSRWLGGVPIQEINLVGTTERYPQFIRNFYYMMGEPPPKNMVRVNQTTKKSPPPGDSGLEREFREFHADDQVLYAQAVERDREISSEIQSETDAELHGSKSFSRSW